ncbi:MAG: MFS transporter [Gaiellales bacterium]
MRLSPAYRELLAPERRWLLAAAGGASFVAASDVLLVATALPSAARDLGGLDRYALVVGCYAAALAVGLPISGAVIDRYGAWHSLVFGCALFAAAGVLAPFVPAMEWLAALRLVQGFAAGFLLAVPLSVVVQRIPQHLQRPAYALSNSVWAVAALAGPVLGAVLTEFLTWRAAFLVPVALTAAVAYAGSRGLRDPSVAPADPHARIHPLGPLLLGATVAALLLDPRLAPIPALAFVASEWRSGSPVFPRTRAGRAIALLCATAGIAFTGADGFVPLGLQVGLGWPILVAALPLVATTAAWASGSFVSARLRVSRRGQMAIAMAIVALGVGIMGLPVLDGRTMAIGIVVAALGMGIQSPIALLSSAAERPSGEGRATASVPLARSIGGGIGIALAGAIVVGHVGRAALEAAKHQHDGVPAVADAVQHADLLLAGLCLVSLPAVLLLRRD